MRHMIHEMSKSNIVIINIDNDEEISLPDMKEVLEAFEKAHDASMPSYFSEHVAPLPDPPPLPILPSVVLMTSAPLPGDYISIEENVYKVEQRYFRLGEDSSWIELWVRAENKQ